MAGRFKLDTGDWELDTLIDFPGALKLGDVQLEVGLSLELVLLERKRRG